MKIWVNGGVVQWWCWSMKVWVNAGVSIEVLVNGGVVNEGVGTLVDN